jgi:hypothetical protein
VPPDEVSPGSPQRREVTILHFSGTGQLKTYVFPQAQAAPADLIATTEWFFDGGTVYDAWMAEALCLVDSSRFDRADVLCVSDGEVHIDARLDRPRTGARSHDESGPFCEVAPWDTRLCCRTCAYQEVRSAAPAFRLPCAGT